MSGRVEPTAAAASLLMHGGLLLLLVSAAPEPVLGIPCAGCGGFSEGPGQPPWWPTDAVLKVPLSQERRRDCPRSRRVERPAALAAGARLPSVGFLPLMLCARIDADGAVVAVRILGDRLAAERERGAVEALRRLRFQPATAGGKPVASWLRLTLSGDPEPPLIL